MLGIAAIFRLTVVFNLIYFMNSTLRISIFILLGILNQSILFSQDTTHTCKVELKSIAGVYVGECKKGFAHGKGESKGIFKYVGNFKYGLPNGKGILYTGDNFFDGNFQDGLKEGKGEMHYLRSNNTDSIIKGYWSGDEFRGKTYKTYQTDAVSKFDRVEVSPSSESGNRITIEISTTTDNPGGQLYSGHLGLTELMSVKINSLLKLIASSESPLKSSWTFEVTEFPITLRGVLSDGRIFNLELYKSADWMFRIYMNK